MACSTGVNAEVLCGGRENIRVSMESRRSVPCRERMRNTSHTAGWKTLSYTVIFGGVSTDVTLLVAALVFTCGGLTNNDGVTVIAVVSYGADVPDNGDSLCILMNGRPGIVKPQVCWNGRNRTSSLWRIISVRRFPAIRFFRPLLGSPSNSQRGSLKIALKIMVSFRECCLSLAENFDFFRTILELGTTL